MIGLIDMANANQNIGLPSPITLPNCQLWWHMMDEETSYQDGGVTLVDADGQGIQQLDDRSDNTLDLIRYDAGSAVKNPINKRNVINGKSVARFDGSDDALILSQPDHDILSPYIAGADKKFAVTLAATNVATTGSVVLFGRSSDSTLSENLRQMFVRVLDNKLSVVIYGANDGSSFRQWTSSGSVPGVAVITFIYDGSVDTNDGQDRGTLRINGSEPTTIFGTNGALLDIPVGSGRTCLGALANSTGSAISNAGEQDIGSVAFISDPSIEDIELVEAYMRSSQHGFGV